MMWMERVRMVKVSMKINECGIDWFLLPNTETTVGSDKISLVHNGFAKDFYLPEQDRIDEPDLWMIADCYGKTYKDGTMAECFNFCDNYNLVNQLLSSVIFHGTDDGWDLSAKRQLLKLLFKENKVKTNS